jgi:hypothetical protein
MMKDSVMVRQGRDSFEAVMIADAMQSCADTDVISVVFCGKAWHVFAAFDSRFITIDAIDRAIDRHTKGELK